MNVSPLAGIRIVDFTWIGAGSFTTKLFSDLGADVIKIESGRRLDQLREAGPFKDGIPGPNRSGYFSDRNSSKRSITLDMTTPEAQGIARRLIKDSDVVANNFTPGTMERFGLGYPEVAQINARIVYLAMSMQGATGPQSKYLGFGLTMGALTGLQYLCGDPDRPPVGTGTNFPDHIPNPTHAAFAVLVALRHRQLCGQGQLIDLAQIEPMISLLGPTVLDHTVNGKVAERRGNSHPTMSPHGVYPCRGNDRWIAVAVRDQTSWKAFADCLPRATRLREPRFDSLADRLRDRVLLDGIIADETRAFDAPTLRDRFQAAGVAAAVVADARDLLENDPQLEHRKHWAWLDHPEVGRTAYSALPFRISGAEVSPSSPAPLLGQHTDEVLGELLSMDSREIERLRERGVLQ